MKKIGIICFYFGKWPKLNDFFLETIKTNESVDFFIFSDNIPAKTFCENVKFNNFSIDVFNQLASKYLNIKTNVKNPIKVCDFRPAFGIIFQDYLKPYDFWGYSDLDLIFGNIRNFFTKELLDEYDIISTRKEFLSGTLTIFKNNDIINNFYKKSSDYKRIHESQDYFNFEEAGHGITPRLFVGENIEDIPPEIDSMMHTLKRSKDIKIHYSNMIVEQIPLNKTLKEFKWELLWNKGNLFNQTEKKDLMAFHLKFHKLFCFFYIPNWKNFEDIFIIRDDGIFKSSDLSGFKSSLLLCKKLIYFIKTWLLSKRTRQYGKRYYFSKIKKTYVVRQIIKPLKIILNKNAK